MSSAFSPSLDLFSVPRLTLGLVCSGLVAASLPAETPTASPSASAEEVVTLDAVVVESFQRDYVAPATSTGLGFEADPFTVPISTTSIPMDILTDQQVNNVEDALRNVAGVSKFKQGNGGEEKFSIRGFDASQSLYKDGARINNAFNATNIATTETANIERYDVLKGPAAILYGTGEPGGVINYVTKKPLFDRPYASVEAIVGSYDYYRGEVDLTGPLGSAGAPFAYRLVTSYQDSDSFRDHTFRERLLVAPSLSWRPREATTATLQYEYITDHYTQDRGQVLEGNDLTGFRYSSRQDPDQFYGIPGWNDRTESEYHRLSALLDHRFSPSASLSVRASSTRVDKALFDSSPRNTQPNNGVVAPNGDVTIRSSYQSGEGESDTLSVHQKFDLDGGSLGAFPVRHQVLVGVDAERIYNDGESFTGSSIVYNLVTRDYTLPPGGVVLNPATRSTLSTDIVQGGLVLQDLVSFGERWHLLLGARYTDFEDRDSGASFDAVSPRTGLVYRPRTDLSFYASWARGFNPTTATGFNPSTGNGIGGAVLDPETSEQFELGLRKTYFDGNLELTASVFDLRKNDVVATDPASIGLPFAEQWSANFGDTRTLGFEFQAIGRITRGLRLIAGYAYLDNELTTVDPLSTSRPGNQLPGIPVHSGSVWGVYELQEGALRGLGYGLGVFAQGETFASTENRARYSGFAQLDSLLYYKRERWKVQLNVKNLTDEEYNLAQAGTTTDNFAAIRVGTSTPRTFTLSAAREF